MVAPVHAAAPENGRISIDKSGKPVFDAPPNWKLSSRSEKEGKQYAEFTFPLMATPGKRAIARVELYQVARSVKLADLNPEEAKTADRARSVALAALDKEVDAMPGMEFEAGGTQYIYTAMDGGKRYHYVQYINIRGVVQAGNDLKPALAVGLRCRSSVDETAPTHDSAAEELEARCYDLMLRVETS